MKIKQKRIEHKQILELQLLKSRVYEQYNKKSNSLDNISLTKILIDFKKVLKIIFKYHKKNKKILFVGITPSTLMKKINRTTNHIALPAEFKLKGFLSNNLKLKNQHILIKTNNLHLLPKMNTKPDLIVMFNRLDSNNSILAESYLAKIPMITFGERQKKYSNFYSYHVPGNLEFLFTNNSIFYICLNFLFKIQNRPKVNKDKTRKLIKNESKKKI